MDYSIYWSDNAIQTLKDIFDWYKEDYSYLRAKKVVKSIRGSVKKISQNPFHYQQCFKVLNPNPNIRNCLVHQTFWVVFEISENHIRILNIISGFQNPHLFESLEF